MRVGAPPRGQARALAPAAPKSRGPPVSPAGTSCKASLGRSSGFGRSATRLPAIRLTGVGPSIAVAGVSFLRRKEMPWVAACPVTAARPRWIWPWAVKPGPHHTSLFARAVEARAPKTGTAYRIRRPCQPPGCVFSADAFLSSCNVRISGGNSTFPISLRGGAFGRVRGRACGLSGNPGRRRGAGGRRPGPGSGSL